MMGVHLLTIKLIQLHQTSFTDNPPDIPPGIPSDKDVYWSYDVKAIDNTGKFP